MAENFKLFFPEAASAASSEAVSAYRTILLRSRLRDFKGTPTKVFSMKFGESKFPFLLRRHFHEAKALGFPRGAIYHNPDTHNPTEGLKEILEVTGLKSEGQISHE